MSESKAAENAKPMEVEADAPSDMKSPVSKERAVTVGRFLRWKVNVAIIVMIIITSALCMLCGAAGCMVTMMSKH